MDPLVFVGSAALVVVSITTHEASHGFVANRLGDPTAREAGRLTLNPIPHIDPFLTILLPLFLLLTGTGIIFGGARPVPVNVSRLRNPRRDWALVGAAGPLSNLAIALGLALVLSVLAHLGGVAPGSRIATILAVGIFVNVLLAVFNLIPIPPLDGSRVVQYALSGSALAAYQQLERFGLIVIVALVFFFRPLQIFLVDAIVTCSAILTAPLGVWPDMEPVLRQALLGWRAGALAARRATGRGPGSSVAHMGQRRPISANSPCRSQVHSRRGLSRAGTDIAQRTRREQGGRGMRRSLAKAGAPTRALLCLPRPRRPGSSTCIPRRRCTSKLVADRCSRSCSATCSAHHSHGIPARIWPSKRTIRLASSMLQTTPRCSSSDADRRRSSFR